MVGYNTSVVPRNVVIYARASTEHEAQLSALENQLDWYKPLLEQHPECASILTIRKKYQSLLTCPHQV